METKFTPGLVADVIFKMLTSRDRVMVKNWRGKARHLRVYSDEDGYYVRIGKRAANKRYIESYKKISDSPFVAVFTLAEPSSQQMWETAMGMRGNAGSPAEKEARAALKKARGE